MSNSPKQWAYTCVTLQKVNRVLPNELVDKKISGEFRSIAGSLSYTIVRGTLPHYHMNQSLQGMIRCPGSAKEEAEWEMTYTV